MKTQSDMELAFALSEQGYHIFPCKDRQKFPRTMGGKAWDRFLGEQETLAGHLVAAGDATGAALCPAEDDPVKLLIIDIDAYSADLETVWFAMAPGETRPEGMGIVRSASGGWHFWFRLPEDTDIRKLPADIDLGRGISGELRVSGPARRLIMLPGSVVTNKHGQAGRYTSLAKLVPAEMPEPPDILMSRILARRGTGQNERATEGGIATEVHHLLSMLELIDEIPEGTRNNVISRIGQIMGRIGPSGKPSEGLLQAIWGKLQPKVGNLDQGEFRIAVQSGWKTGRKNADTYSPREKHPTITDIREECDAVFGFTPWLCEVRDSSGKTKEWQVGFGGSAKRRNEASSVTKVKDLGEVLPTLTRLGNADPDTVVRSPLFVQVGWTKALNFMLQAERGVDQMGIPPEERFWGILDEYARMSAGDMLFLDTWTGKRPSGSAQAFIVWPPDEAPSLVVPAGLQETLLLSVGDLPKAKRLVKQHLLDKALRGMKGGKKVWVCSLAVLEQTTQEYVGSAYDRWLQKEK